MKKQKSFTLVEILVAMMVFIVISTISAGVFVSELRNQRKSLASQELFDQTSYLMEYMSRAIRMAKKDDLEGINCLSGDKVNYEIIAGQGIKFRNYKDECQRFYLENFQLKEEKGGGVSDLTSVPLRVLNFNTNLIGETQTDNLQPRVTFFLEIESKEATKIKIQTTISQRNPDIER